MQIPDSVWVLQEQAQQLHQRQYQQLALALPRGDEKKRKGQKTVLQGEEQMHLGSLCLGHVLGIE